jgi:Tol biopolymer transport system component
VAQSLVHIGEAYRRINEPAKSRAAFQRIIDDYKTEREPYVTAVVRLFVAPDTRKPGEITTPFSPDPMAFALSPDGKTLVALASRAWGSELWLHHVDTGTSEILPGTVNPRDCCGQTPFFKPDGSSIGFFAEGKLKTIELATRTVRVLADAPFAAGGSWSRDDTIVFSPTLQGSLQRVSARSEARSEDGAVKVLATAAGRPHFLPDGRRFLYHARAGNRPVLRIRSLDNDKEQTLGVLSSSAASFASPDRLFYTGNNGQLLFQRINAVTLQFLGSPQRVVDRVAAFSTSQAAPLAYRSGLVAARKFYWWDRTGRRTGFLGADDKEDPSRIRFSPDGKTVLFSRRVLSGNAGAYRGLTEISVITGRSRGFNSSCSNGVWSPNGGSIACAAQSLFIYSVSGRSTRPMRPASQGFSNPVDWSPDGKFVLYNYYDGDGTGDNDLLAQPVDGGAAIPVATTSAFEFSGRFSPNGQWVAYDSHESGKQFEIYLQQFPVAASSRVKVSVNGGYDPQWSRDGKELYFLSPDNHLMVVAVSFSADGKELKMGTPARLFEAKLPAGSEYAPGPDGKQFLINSPREDLPPIIVSNIARASGE